MPQNIDAITEALSQTSLSQLEASGVFGALKDAYRLHINQKVLAIIHNNSNDILSTIAEFKQFLADNWKLIQGTNLCYTNNPEHSITHLMCVIAEYVVQEENKNQHPPISILNVLMPEVATESIDPAYPELAPEEGNNWQDVAIKSILKTHILGREAKYLIPVSLIRKYDATPRIPVLYNPYFDVFKHPEEMVKLNEEEIGRLIDHSQLTRAIYEAKKTFESHANEQTNLLGNLRYFLSQLEYNSVNGIGSELAAGNGVYLAIFNFFTYYDRLGEDEIARIPEGVRNALTSIRLYASNKNTLNNIGSCLATRRSKLRQAMQGNDEILSGIGLRGENHTHLILSSKEQLEEASERLRGSIENATYVGKDSLSVTLSLMRHFNFRILINQFTDLNVLKTLNIAEISAFCSDAEYRPQILQALGMGSNLNHFPATRTLNIENLVLLSIEFSPPKLQAMLSSLGPEFIQTCFRNGDDFACTLLALDQERRDIYCQLFKAQFPDLIKNVYDLIQIMKFLDIEKRKELLLQVKHKKAEALQVETLLSIVALPVKYLDRLYANLEARLPLMNEDPAQFESDFMWVYALEFAKASVLPVLCKYTLSPFQNKQSFFNTALVAAGSAGFFALFSPGLALGLAIAAAGYAVAALVDYLRGDSLAASQRVNKALLILAVPLIQLVLLPVAILATVSLVTRAIATGVSYIADHCSSEKENEPAPEPGLALHEVYF